MKTLLILDKAGKIGCQYAVVEGDQTKFAGLMLNHNTDTEKECVQFLIDGYEKNEIYFVESLTYLNNKKWDKVALITYF